MKYQDFKKQISSAIFTRQDVRLRELKIFDYQFSLWQKQGRIIKLKNGVYLFAEAADQIAPEELARHLYSPSYLSLEKALSIHGLVPEMVYGITSVTPKTTRSFKNKCGSFSYRHIKPDLFFGYKEVKTTFSTYLMAEPEKALLDYLYLHKIKNEAGWAALRLNQSAAKNLFRPRSLSKYVRIYNNKTMTNLCRRFLGVN